MADDKAKHQDQWGSSKPWRGQQRPTVHALRGCGGAQMDDFLWLSPSQLKGPPRWLSGKKIHLPMQETWVPFLAWEDPLEKEIATHSSILALRIPRREGPGGLLSIGS